MYLICRHNERKHQDRKKKAEFTKCAKYRPTILIPKTYV